MTCAKGEENVLTEKTIITVIIPIYFVMLIRDNKIFKYVPSYNILLNIDFFLYLRMTSNV